MMAELSADEYRQLISSCIPSAMDADTSEPEAKQLFTPNAHGRALDPDVTLVRGNRGVGKTWWFLTLQDESLRRLAAKEYGLGRLADEVTVRPGYGTRLDPQNYPVPSVLRLLLADHDPELIWQAVCLFALGEPEVVAQPTWPTRLQVVLRDPSRFEEHLARLDAGSSGISYLILFDALDRMSADAGETDRLITALLKVALELRTRTRSIRAKVFARPDLLEARLDFPDASKLTANAVSLSWSDASLYGLFFTLMANAATERAARFRSVSGDKWKTVAPDVWRADRLAGDRDAQAKLFETIAGPYMGTNHRRGRSYPWLPAHLSDGKGEASPRSFLSALQRAVEDTRTERAGHPFPLHFDSIKMGVRQASQIRVREIEEDIPWVKEAIGRFDISVVPVNEDEVIRSWKRNPLGPMSQTRTQTDASVRVGPRGGSDPRSLIRDLETLGIMTRRGDGRLDIPDVYRIAFDIGRKGGVPRTKGA